MVALQAWAALSQVAAAAEIEMRVLCPSALRAPALEIARGYARETGHRIEFLFASAGVVHKRAAMNEPADVVVGGEEAIVALAKLGAADASTVTRVARTALALAGRPDVVLPASDRADAVGAALRAAVAVGVPDAQRGMAGAAQASDLIAALGLRDELQPKRRAFGSVAEAQKLLSAGVIDLALLPMSEFDGTSGMKLSGPIVSPSTVGYTYAVAVLRSAVVPQAARMFIDYLRSPAAASAFRQAGYLPAD